MASKKFGYARVSTTDQNEDRQVIELLNAGIDERDIFVDKQSGRTFERTNYLALRNNIANANNNKCINLRPIPLLHNISYIHFGCICGRT